MKQTHRWNGGLMSGVLAGLLAGRAFHDLEFVLH